MSAIAVNPAYTALLVKFPPRIVRSEEQNQSYVDTLYELEQRHETLSSEEVELAALLTLLVEDYEEKHYGLPRSSPIEVLEFLLDQHGLGAQDLDELLGSDGLGAEMLSGLRTLNTEQIRRLSDRFAVSPEVFF